MAVENVRPTRLELLRTRRRIVVAKRGLNLLKLKRTALIAEFFRISKEAMRLRGDLAARIADGYEAIRLAETIEGPTRLENISMLLPDLPEVAVATKNVMGVRTPQVDGGNFQRLPTISLLDLPTSIGEAVRRFQEIVRYIKFRFDEMERDSFSMLKTVKRKMEQEAARGASA